MPEQQREARDRDKSDHRLDSGSVSVLFKYMRWNPEQFDNV